MKTMNRDWPHTARGKGGGFQARKSQMGPTRKTIEEKKEGKGDFGSIGLETPTLRMPTG